MIVNITSERTHVKVSIEVGTARIGKAVMVLFNLIGLVLIGIALAEWLLGLLMMGILWSLFFGWLTLWNFYGKELLTINTKSLSYQHVYGFYKTAVVTRKMSRALNISLVEAKEEKGEPRFNLIFESYNEHDLPEEIYRTALAISAQDLEKLKVAIRRLYFEKATLDLIRMPYLLN